MSVVIAVRFEVHRGLKIVGGLAEFADALAEATRQFRQLLRSKNDQSDHEDDADLPKTEPKHAGIILQAAQDPKRFLLSQNTENRFDAELSVLYTLSMKDTNQALQTDLYQLTMAAGYFHRGLHNQRVSFELFVRNLPKNRRFLVFCGLETVLEHLQGLRFTEAQIDYLRQIPALRPAMSFEFIEYLRDFRFQGDVWAMPEGTVAFAREPLIRVTGNLLETQLVETFLLSAVNSQTAVASKAALVVGAAQGRSVLEFGTRRTSPEEAVATARAAFVAGFDGTSNVEAGYRHDIPLAGTAAHSWTMAHTTERAAFEAYLDTYPGAKSTLLIDTYDTLQGLETAIAVGGADLGGVRLDSGDLLALSKAVRERLDAAGLNKTKIVATGDLNEVRIKALLDAGAPIDSFGVGTELARVTDSPHLGGVYKLVYDHTADRPVAKLSEGKATLPGVHQVFRVLKDGKAYKDIIGGLEEFHVDATPLLVPWLEGGKSVRARPSLSEIRKVCRTQVAALPKGDYPVHTSDALDTLVEQVQQRERSRQEAL